MAKIVRKSSSEDGRSELSRREVLRLGGATAGGLLLGANLLTACDPAADCNVTIGGPQLTSALQFGLADADQSLTWTGNPDAVGRAEALMGGALAYDNIHIMAWGAGSPWPNEGSTARDFTTIDAKLEVARAAGVTPVLTFCEAPWWMKGKLLANGSTQLLTAAQEWERPIAYESRILDNKMGKWLQLVGEITDRYLRSPWNVRHFLVWNELKGYWNPMTGAWDASTSPGVPSGPNAKHGYTYLYNQVRSTVRNKATSLGISADAVKIGGPYVPMVLRPTPVPAGPVPEISKPYGYVDQRSVDAMKTWLAQNTGAEFLVVDGWNVRWKAADGSIDHAPDPYAANEVFADVVRWIRAQPQPAAKTLPIWFAEWYSLQNPQTVQGLSPALQEAANDSIKASGAIRYLTAGGAVALNWTGTGDGTSAGGLWSSTTSASGGYATPWGTTSKVLHDHFGPGTSILTTTTSSPVVEVVSSPAKTLLVNTTAASKTVSVAGTAPRTLTPYQVLLIDTPPH